MIETPQTTEKYHVQRMISSSESADIFLAYIEGISGFKRQIALKKYHRMSPDDLNILTIDAKNSGLLSHANIVQIIDLGQWDDSWFVAMEYVEGQSLEHLLNLSQQMQVPIPKEIVYYIAIELLNGLEYAHSISVQFDPNRSPGSILHCNLEPSNILINKQGNVKIKGFSHSCRIPRDSLFFPPDEHPDHRTDLWSVGAILLSLLNGIEELDPVATITSHGNLPIDRIVQQALHPDPSRRFQSTRAMKEAIFNQCGDIGLNAPYLLVEFLSEFNPMAIDPFESEAAEQPTQISKTVSKMDLDMNTVSLRLDAAPPPGTKTNALSATAEPKTTMAPHTPPYLLPLVCTLLMIALGLGFALGKLTEGFTPSARSEVRIFFPTDVNVVINDQPLSSGERLNLPAERSTKAVVLFPDGSKRELDIVLRSGESRMISIEHLNIKH